jgi:hypothetical protein
MPVTESEWNDGEIDADEGHPETTAVGEYDTEKDLVVSFLSENHDSAFTRAETVRGVDFGETTSPETVYETLTNLPNQLLDVAGDLAASGIVVDDVSEALDELVSEGTVERKQIERQDGEREVYYRLADGA